MRNSELMLRRRRFALLLALCAATISTTGCQSFMIGNRCDMTPDGSVWLTVVRLVWEEQKFYGLHGRYGELVEMTNPLDGLPDSVTAGQVGSYTITIELTKAGYILRANPERQRSRRPVASFYGDQTGLITFNRSGQPAGPDSERMAGQSGY